MVFHPLKKIKLYWIGISHKIAIIVKCSLKLR
mgnify:CR=1 FL=1